VITVGALADIDVVRLLCVCGARVVGLLAVLAGDEGGTAEVGESLPCGFTYDRPRLKDGGWYVTPNSGS
jgi:hypothetical protein